MFGTAGAVIGATTGKTVNTVSSMYINVYTSQGDCRKIHFITITTDKDSTKFRDAKNEAEKTMALLYAIKDNT